MTEESVFSRWSRRKRQIDAEDVASPADAPSQQPATANPDFPEPDTEQEEAELLERLGLPRPEAMAAGDDFSLFMKAGVPEFLRKRALRVLWRSNPVLANLDGLNDYDEDFRSPEMTRKVLATAYQVGRGFLPADPPPAPVACDDETADDAAPPPDPVLAQADADVASSDGEETAAPAPPDTGEDLPSTRPETEPGFRPGRMRFES
jgi:hypothetical protein